MLTNLNNEQLLEGATAANDPSLAFIFDINRLLTIGK